MTKTYPNNLTWEQWELIADLFPKAKPGGRPRNVSIYAVLNAIMYVLCQGCTWRALPGDFPAWQTVYGYFRRWQKDDIWLIIHDKLYQWVKVSADREPSPSEAAVDSQSVETATIWQKNILWIINEAELSHLQSLTKTGKHKARTITRANILLMASESYPDNAIDSTLRVNVSTVERTREKFVVGGLEYALEDRPHPPKPRKLDGKQEAFLVATACSTAPEGRTRWTMQLLAEQLVNLGIVDSISDETVRQTLKKTK